MQEQSKINTTTFKAFKEYVCWIDIMGTKNTMSESFQKAANFIIKFHSSVINAVKDKVGIKCYPLMDGVFITSPNYIEIRKIINKIFATTATIFMDSEKNAHRFIIKGSIAYGDIAHGQNIDSNICENLSEEIDYKRSIMCGLPMIQAFKSEHIAPPFGVYIHESARNPYELQGKYYNWTFPRRLKKEILLSKIISYFNWCEYFHQYLELEKTKITLYKELANEYFTDRMANDSLENHWEVNR